MKRDSRKRVYGVLRGQKDGVEHWQYKRGAFKVNGVARALSSGGDPFHVDLFQDGIAEGIKIAANGYWLDELPNRIPRAATLGFARTPVRFGLRTLLGSILPMTPPLLTWRCLGDPSGLF